jgi:dihydrofolate reductase
MRKLSVFNFISIDGYYKDLQNDISWHRHGGEESEYSEQSLEAENILLFGRITYGMMAGFWPTPDAIKNIPLVAERMNRSEKIVFSNTLENAEWNNTSIVKGDIAAQIRELKKTPGKDLTILGSGSIVTQFANSGLIDGYEIMIDPVALGGGTPLFQGLKSKLDMRLVNTRTFSSGVITLSYEPLNIK